MVRMPIGYAIYTLLGLCTKRINSKKMEYEYKDRDWEMWLGGTSDNEPNKKEIIEHAKGKGYKLNDIEIWFDNMQGFWRFSADLVKH